MRKVCTICSSCGPTNCKQCKFVNYDGKWEKQRSKNDGENLYQWYFDDNIINKSGTIFCQSHYDNVLQEADGVLIVNVQHAPLQQADDGKNQTLKLPAGCEVAIKHVEESEASLFFLVKENMIEIEIHVYYENTQNDKRGE